MAITDQIIEIMLRQGELAAQQQRERIAAEEEQRQSKHRLLKNTLKAIATFGPYFIPGAGIIPALTKAGVSVAASRVGASPGRVPAGLGYTQFAGPMARNDWYQTPWDEE